MRTRVELLTRLGDYRRTIKYLLTPLYFVSLLHSLVARVDLKQDLDSEDDTTRLTDIPLSDTNYKQNRGQYSSGKIDPMRGKLPKEDPFSRTGSGRVSSLSVG
jgi:hypothetical protein